MNLKALIAAPLVAWLMIANAATIVKPQGWSFGQTGKNSERYQMGVDTSVTWEGKPAVTVVASGQRSTSYGYIHAYTDTAGYVGKRVRFSGMLKLAGVDGWAGAYLAVGEERIDDNKDWRPAVGDTGNSAQWIPVSVVADVPDNAERGIRMGLMLVGNGQAWLSDLKFEEVGKEVALTTSRAQIDWEQLIKEQLAARLARQQQGKSTPYNLELKTQ